MTQSKNTGLRPRLSLFVSHPTQFEGPLYPKIAQRERLDLEVYFWRTDQPTQRLTDPEVGLKPQWDNLSLTDGYSYSLLPAQSWACWRFILDKALRPLDRRVVLVNGWSEKAPLLALLAGILRRIPIILRQDTVDLYPASRLRSVRRWAVRSMLYRIPAAFMVTSTLAQQHLLCRGVEKEDISFFSYAVDNEFLAETAARHRPHRADLRRALGIDPQAKVIMTALKFVPREGVWDLLRAYSELTDWHDSTVLLLAGDGPSRADLEAYVRQRPLMKVVFTGWVPYSRLIELLAISDLFVHPGVEEPWGCSVQEAAACRLPIVGSDLVGATYDLVRSGENGLVYQGGSVEALRDALVAMLERQEQWAGMGERSWQIAQNWGHDRAILELERAVDHVLAKGQRSPPWQRVKSSRHDDKR